jgi:BspA type Leucine rich repeat region (6 copies)
MTNLYTCRARVVITGNLEIISGVSQNHMPNRNNNDVKGISIRDMMVTQLPQNFHQFFPNLQSIDLQQSQVEWISQVHFKNLAQLAQIHFNANSIHTLESNLFIYNPTLIAVMFNNNPIRHVGFEVFEDLPLLTDLQFRSTTCINQQAQNQTSISNLIFQLYANCPPTFEMIEAKIIDNDQRNITEQIVERVNPVVMSVFHMTQELNVIHRQLDDLQTRCGC